MFVRMRGGSQLDLSRVIGHIRLGEQTTAGSIIADNLALPPVGIFLFYDGNDVSSLHF